MKHSLDSHPLWILAFLAAAWTGVPPADACNVPVFRYALERWEPDVYRVTVYHQDPIDREALDLLQHDAVERGLTANFSVQIIEMKTGGGKPDTVSNGIRELPWVEIAYPPNASVQGVAWDGPFNRANVLKILRSPVRSAIAKMLSDGDAAVWVLLKSGNRQKDGKAAETLRHGLEHASAELKIPETGVDAVGNPIQVSDFKNYTVHFKMLEAARKDPEETVLVNLLLGMESDLEYTDEPMAFPVFGRGRVLYALVGNGIQEKTIFAACRSVIGWCSCEIKALNPGTDLLISADWSNPSGGKMVQLEALPPLTGFTDFMPEKAEKSEQGTKSGKESVHTPLQVKTIRHDSVAQAEVRRIHAKSNVPLLRNFMVLAGMGIALVLIASVVLKSKRDKR